ncbi:ADP-glyceromanno-heptose 6-epimerase [Candidatus Aerophobetes bacterium]|uniref:ADP-glyceromanno-heptose 6-epimerase n=1 Tax=Aerophobetes bacterium TaxID=2030807 RepID=A0A2A4X5X7_UNCAE|nr:MAG: ADP-glyceromanno-heptose 6-epimerase [Candidatus Aerophobetes bacterium]
MDQSSKLIVITGGAGFIGSNLVRYYNKQGFTNIVIIDHFDMGNCWHNLLNLRYKQLVNKSRAFEFLQENQDEIGAIFHLGAISDTTCADSSLIMENNYQFSIDLAIFALNNSIPFLYASSAATYGDGSLGFEDTHEKLHALKPLNLYGFSKHAFDLWLLENGHIDKVTGVKYFNIFGPGEQHKGRMASMVYHMSLHIEKEGCVKLFASNHKDFVDGGQKRDFFYVKDAVKMTALLLEKGIKGIYNVGMGEANTWNMMAKYVFTAMDKPINIEYIPMPKDLEGKYQNFTRANMDKFYTCVNKLGVEFTLDYSFKTAISDYICNYLKAGERCTTAKF